MKLEGDPDYAHLCCTLFNLRVVVLVCLFIHLYLCTTIEMIKTEAGHHMSISDLEGNLLKKLTGTDGILLLNRG